MFDPDIFLVIDAGVLCGRLSISDFFKLNYAVVFFLTEKQNGVPHKKQRFVFYFCVKELR